MRFFEITSGVRIHCSLEEQEILDRAAHDLAKSELDDRAQEIARKMVSRGILKRIKKDNKIYFRKNKETLRRD